MGKVIGIDLGTTNSCVSIFERGESKIIPNKEGKTNQKRSPQIESPQRRPPANGECCSFNDIMSLESRPEIAEAAITCTKPTTIEANSGHHPFPLVSPK